MVDKEGGYLNDVFSEFKKGFSNYVLYDEIKKIFECKYVFKSSNFRKTEFIKNNNKYKKK